MNSLRSRLIFSHILPILVIIPVVGVVLIYLLETQVLIANISNNDELVQQAVLVADIASSYNEIWDNPTRAQAFVNLISPRITAKVMLLDPVGRLLVSSDQQDSKLVGQVLPQASNQSQSSQGEVVVHYNQTAISDVVVPVITSEGELIGYVSLVNPLAGVYQRSQSLRQVTILVLVGGLLLGIILALVLSAQLEKPLRRATQAVLELANGQQLAPLKEQGPAEIRLLARAFNTLVQRLQTLEDSRKRLLANLVHELGTPLGALRSAVQAMLRGADEDASFRRELLGGMKDELDLLQHLLDDLAHLHDQVLGSLELNRVSVQLSEWLSKTIGPWREAAQEKGLTWEAEIPPDLPVIDIDPEKLAQALGNLLSNAVRYTPAGGKVTVWSNIQQNNFCIYVDDTGPGIHPDEQDRIFTPFFRGKAARRFSEGMGLGLTIARDLVVAHRGELVIENKPSQGSRFVIRLPLTKI